MVRAFPSSVARRPILDTDSRMIGGVGVFQDMSERMRQDEILREERRLLKSVFDILPVGVWIADRSGLLVGHNPAGERIWRGARYVPIARYDEYKGWWLDSGKPIAAEEWAMARAITNGETSLGELIRIQCFDGTFKTIIHSAAPLRDEAGAITGAIVVNEDITALHEAQEKQRASEELLRTVFDLLPVGLWIADREGRITLVNRAGDRIWQGTRYVAPPQFGEYKAWWVETGKPIAPEEWGISRAVRLGETSRGELIRIQCFDGSSKTVMNWAAPIRTDAGELTGAVAVNEDVTSLVHTQEQLRQAVRDREDILAIVSHDLRNPLASIMMNADAIKWESRALAEGESIRDCGDEHGRYVAPHGGTGGRSVADRGRAGRSFDAGARPHDGVSSAREDGGQLRGLCSQHDSYASRSRSPTSFRCSISMAIASFVCSPIFWTTR